MQTSCVGFAAVGAVGFMVLASVAFSCRTFRRFWLPRFLLLLG